MNRLPSVHPLQELSGTPRACGRQYGELQAEAIDGFFHLEVRPTAWRLGYAAKCWNELSQWDAPVAEFVRGMARGSGRTVEELTLILLHEEICHTKHCTAIGATGAGTTNGHPVIGENWDWNSHLYPWSSLLRVRSSAGPRAVHYAFPGLWACAGINEHGLSLVWTGAGSIPLARPKVGVPTYALIAGILARKTCDAAIQLLQRTRNAGFYIFFIADAHGDVWVIEGWPGRFKAIRCVDVLTRANHYECETAARATRLAVDKSGSARNNTWHRAQRMAKLARQFRGKIDARRVEQFLSDQSGRDGRTICQCPSGTRRTMTIDSLYCLPQRRQLWIARGLPARHEFVGYEV